MSYHKNDDKLEQISLSRRRSIPKRLRRNNEFQPYSNIGFKYDDSDESSEGFQIFL